MSTQETRIYFITWPDGKLFEGTQNSIGEDHAIGRALRTWLIPQNFPGLDLGQRWGGGPMHSLWQSMERAGFRVQSVPVDVTGVSY